MLFRSINSEVSCRKLSRLIISLPFLLLPMAVHLSLYIYSMYPAIGAFTTRIPLTAPDSAKLAIDHGAAANLLGDGRALSLVRRRDQPTTGERLRYVRTYYMIDELIQDRSIAQ